MCRILVVDDEQLIADSIAEILQEEIKGEIEVACRYTAVDALLFLGHVKTDIVITDVKMPGMDGTQLLDEIVKRWSECYIVFLTGYKDFEPIYKASRYKRVRYLLKSEGPDAVVSVVRQLIEEIADPDADLNQRLDEQEIAGAKWLRSLLAGYEESCCEKYAWYRHVDPEKSFLLVFSTIPESCEKCVNPVLEFYQLKDLAVRHLSRFCQFMQIYYAFGTEIWMLQSHDLRALLKDIRKPLAELQNKAAEMKIQRNFLLIRQPLSRKTCRGEMTLFSTLIVRAAKSSDAVSIENIWEKEDLELRPLQNAFKKYLELISIALDIKNRSLFNYAWEQVSDAIYKIDGLSKESTDACLSDLDMLIQNMEIKRGYKSREPIKYENFSSVIYEDTEDCMAVVQKLQKRFHSVLDRQEEEDNHALGGRLGKIDRYIEKNMQGDCSLSTVAGIVHFNPSYFSRIFKNEMHQSFSEYVNEKRLAAARYLLLNSDMKIQQICKKTSGYSTANFSRHFKYATGMTPQEYRRSYSDGVDASGLSSTGMIH
ncbi:helix-turn-helix domain-containing protein [Eubacteriales bacterium mix99]